MRKIRQWTLLPEESVDFPSLKILKARLESQESMLPEAIFKPYILN